MIQGPNIMLFIMLILFLYGKEWTAASPVLWHTCSTWLLPQLDVVPETLPCQPGLGQTILQLPPWAFKRKETNCVIS